MRQDNFNCIQKLLFLSLFCIDNVTNGDPYNLVFNGDFESQFFLFEGSFEFDVAHKGQMDYIPYFEVAYGGVQVLDAGEFVGDNGTVDAGKSNILIHLNYAGGPGVLRSAELWTPREGATYNLTFDLADNPDGGPLDKTLEVSILVNERVVSSYQRQFTASSPYNTRAAIAWNSNWFTFVGTGLNTVVQFQSLVPGPFGPFIDNLQVTLLSLVENGSFEMYSGALVHSNITYFDILKAPTQIITGWTVTAGKIKYASGLRWQTATDFSNFLLDLNANGTNGTITSFPFVTKPGARYRMIYDTAANPDTIPPLQGHILASAISYPVENDVGANRPGEMMASKSVLVHGEGFTIFSIGWLTNVLEFKAREGAAIVQFSSQMEGSINGPLLDNVMVFEVSAGLCWRPHITGVYVLTFLLVTGPLRVGSLDT